ncbi:HAD-IC family P-type ATPase [Deinococcus multiflagellatus]|uniref:HAD-IC family P-type ATPase n=1 Tax=Deinococcus multiflagellatus TaxID=1656887 RepID=A0ABW1ZV09_9DEIO
MRQALAELRGSGAARLVMLTGDRREVAQAVAQDTGVDDFRAELLPEDKLRLIAELPAPVAMVGDGVNDAPALARADLGVAVASGTDVAIASADVVLMRSDLGKLAGAVRLARAARRTVALNLTFAFGVMVVVAPLAVAGQVPLPLGVLAHEGGTVFVVFMGLRLLRLRL